MSGYFNCNTSILLGAQLPVAMAKTSRFGDQKAR